MCDIAFLIPAHNDEWTLHLCLKSLHEAYLDCSVHVLENGSTDRTARVADWWSEHSEKIHAYHTDVPLNNATRRNCLMTGVDARHLCFIDADMVLIEKRADAIVELAEDPDVDTRRFRFCQPYGDFQHISRESHSDRCCHQYVDYDACQDFKWKETSAGFGVNNYNHGPATESILFWHLNGLRPDYRLVNRDLTRDYHAGDLDTSPAEVVDDMPEEKIHERALDWLRGGRAMPIDEADIPPMPRVMKQRWPGRFKLTVEDGDIIDRVDNGWTPPWEAEND